MLTTSTNDSFAPHVKTFASTDIVPDSLIHQTATVTTFEDGDAAVVSALYVDDATAGFIPEGNDIAPTDPPLSAVSVRTGKLGCMIKCSQELWEQTQVGSQLATSVSRTITKAANAAYLTQANPVAPAITPPGGILSTAGLVAAAAPITGSLDGLVDLLAELEGNGASPSTIIVAPTTWAALRKLKQTDTSNQSLLGAGVVDSAHLLLDVPVIVSSAMPANSGAVLDSTAIVAVAGPLRLAQSSDYYFNSDAIAVRCTWRIGQVVVKPNRIGTFSTATA